MKRYATTDILGILIPSEMSVSRKAGLIQHGDWVSSSLLYLFGIVLLAVCLMADFANAQDRAADANAEHKRRVEIRRQIEISFNTSASANAHVDDSLALVALYGATAGVSWTNTSGWLQLPLAQWHGVVLDSEGRVTEISLSSNNLTGQIPPEVGNMAELQVLYMPENKLSGALPSELGKLDQLVTLSLWENELTGNIPSEISALPSLRDLLLFSNGLVGDIPPELGNIASLERLWLDYNQLRGPIPAELANLENLTELFVDSNNLTGTIPKELVQLNKIISLYLGNNNLEGPIPPELSNLISLQNLSLAGNGHTGTIPGELAQTRQLTKLYLNDNQLTGEIPGGLEQLSLMTTLDLSDNQLTGAIPERLGMIFNLRVLNLSDNGLTGEIPRSIGFATGLTHLDLSGNQLSGALPGSFESLNRMQVLDLSRNQLSGTLDTIYPMIRLRQLRLRGNEFEGELYAGLGLFPLLAYVDLGQNQLSGSLDAMFTRATSIEVLKLDGNAFSGNLPDKITLSTSLVDIRIQDNKLVALPDLTPMESLDTLDVSGNNLSFADLVPNAAFDQRGAFRYAPQDSVDTYLVRTQTDVEFFVRGTAPGNTYQWYRDNEAIVGARSETLRVELSAPRAIYHSAIRNSRLPELTLTSRPTDSNDDPTSVATQYVRGREIEMQPNYPNPFATATWIPFDLHVPAHIEINIFDLLGRRLRTVADETFSAGTHRVSFEARDLAPGLYQIRIESGEFSDTRFISLVR